MGLRGAVYELHWVCTELCVSLSRSHVRSCVSPAHVQSCVSPAAAVCRPPQLRVRAGVAAGVGQRTDDLRRALNCCLAPPGSLRARHGASVRRRARRLRHDARLAPQLVPGDGRQWQARAGTQQLMNVHHAVKRGR